MNLLKIAIVEDDDFTAELLKYHLELNPDNEVTIYSCGAELLNRLSDTPDLIFLDYNLKKEKGDLVLQKIQSKTPDTPVVMVSGQEDITTAIDLIKAGAYDYVVKDENVKDRLWAISNQVRNQTTLKKQVVRLQTEVEKKYDYNHTIIGESKSLKALFPMVERACMSTIVVSISGETGTGKEVLAKTIHYSSARKEKPFVAVNMAAIPKDLVESELFGHEKGAFTSANDRRIGKFEEANGGTIFLDEMGDMDLPMQAKLLRVLQEQQVTRVGGNAVVHLDVRVIIATHKNLFEEVGKGNFREDLYYRLLGISIELPPLRNRGNDIILLARHFMDDYGKKHAIPPKKLSSESVNMLLSHSFPGNIRELKSIVELAMVLSDSDEIGPENLQIQYGNFLENLLSRELTLKDYNREIILHYLKRYHNKVRLAAEKLDVGKSTIYRILEEKNKETDEQSRFS